MRNATILCLMILGLGSRVMAQGNIADVKTLRADPKTHMFNDGKHTVEGYVYAMLENSSACCGNDAIFVEVVFDKEGFVTAVKPMTGKNDCYKKSVCDILKNVRWESAGVSTVKTIYFEVKPVLPCSGSSNENAYKAINIDNNPHFGSEVAMTDPEEVKEEVKEEVVEEVVEEVQPEVKEEVVADNGDEESSEESSETEIVETPKGKIDVRGDNEFLSDKPVANNNNRPTEPVVKSGGNTPIPPQDNREYKPLGDRQPDPSNPDTHGNVDPGKLASAEYSSKDNQLALKIKQELRKTGYCGYAQAAIELTVDPSGNVVANRIMYCNDDKVTASLPVIVSGLKFEPRSVRYNYFTYVQFKTEIVCSGKGSLDLEKQPNVIVNPKDN
jgi:hypothetical protein